MSSKTDRPNNAATDLSSRLALRPREAAVALGVSERKLWEITSDRTSGIPHTRFGKAVVYPVDELRRWLAERASATRRA